MAKVRINEEQLNRIVTESVIRILKEEQQDEFLNGLGAAFNGIRQGMKQRRELDNQDKQATATARQDRRTAANLQRRYGRYIARDKQVIAQMRQRYNGIENIAPEFSSLSKALYDADNALENMSTEIGNNATTANDNYKKAQETQAINRTNRNAETAKRFASMFGAQPTAGTAGATGAATATGTNG